MRYVILWAASMIELQDKVNAAIDAGSTLYRGLVIQQDAETGVNQYYQVVLTDSIADADADADL